MRLLPLSNDFVFKSIFAKNEDLLLDLLNSFPEFSGKKQIRNLQVMNPELPKSFKDDKLSILDIRAEDISGNKFLIEMQASHQAYFTKRVMYYWSSAYSKAIRKGQNYDRLPRIYSFNFTSFVLFQGQTHFHSVFEVKEKNNPEICLTEDLEIHIVELPKLEKLLPELQSNLEDWVFLLKEAENLKESDMKTLERKNPKVKKAISELKILSHDKKARILYEERLKADLDYNSGIQHAFSKGKEEGEQIGIQKGELNSLYLSIEMILETKFTSKGLALLPEIKKIKDISVLRNILRNALKAKDLKEIKKAVR